MNLTAEIRNYQVKSPLPPEKIKISREYGVMANIPAEVCDSYPNKTYINNTENNNTDLNMSAFVRKMAMDGYVIRLDLSEMNEFVRLLRINSNNLNQSAKKANETGNIYLADIKELQKQQDDLWNAMKEFLQHLSNI